MKRTGQCPKCGGTRIVHLQRVLDATEWGPADEGGMASSTDPPSKRRGLVPVSRCLARIVADETRTSPGLFGGTSTQEVRVERLVAQTEAYVCTECGWFEEYVARPEEVPWNRAEGGRWYSGDAPPR